MGSSPCLESSLCCPFTWLFYPALASPFSKLPLEDYAVVISRPLHYSARSENHIRLFSLPLVPNPLDAFLTLLLKPFPACPLSVQIVIHFHLGCYKKLLIGHNLSLTPCNLFYALIPELFLQDTDLTISLSLSLSLTHTHTHTHTLLSKALHFIWISMALKSHLDLLFHLLFSIDFFIILSRGMF